MNFYRRRSSADRVRIARLYGLTVSAMIVATALVGLFVVREQDGASSEFRGGSPPSRLTMPSFRLHDHRGRAVEASDVRGKVALVTFLETECDEACPLIAAQIGAALDLIPREERARVAALAISVHPTDDTPASVRAFLRRHRVEGKLRYLIGSERELRRAWRGFKVLSALDSGHADTHSAPVRVFDPEGEWVSTLHPGIDLTPENLAHDAQAALQRSN